MKVGFGGALSAGDGFADAAFFSGSAVTIDVGGGGGSITADACLETGSGRGSI